MVYWNLERSALCRNSAYHRNISPRATSPRPSPGSCRVSATGCRTRSFWASRARARPSRWPTSSRSCSARHLSSPTTRYWRRSSVRSSASSSRTMPWSTLSPITIITSRRLTSPPPIPISPRTPPSTRRSTACATRPRRPFWSGGTSSSWQASPASTPWETQRSTRAWPFHFAPA